MIREIGMLTFDHVIERGIASHRPDGVWQDSDLVK